MKDLTKIKVLVCDCDGVLTDGLLIYDKKGELIKHFSAHDGLGFQMLKHTELLPVVITGRTSKLLKKRCNDLGIKHLYQAVRNKKKKLDELLAELNLKYENVAYIGDDWNDFNAMKDVALKIAPANARDNFKMTVDYVCEKRGGDGAVRDAIEFILRNQNALETTIEKFLLYLSND
jgi:3-deoxy-D-manno-octulosonate 8-phosphate phosphatase (KDO 8-P phosphatase)